jgi:site-specific recombinase XerC
VRALLRESLLELKVMGRSQRTIDWYEQKMDWYRSSGGVKNLEQLNAFELKRFLAEQHERGLSANAIHGFFQVIKSFAN